MRKLTIVCIAVIALCAAPAQARLRAPGLQAPGNGANVQSLPAFVWHGVRHAASYQFEFSADRKFSSGVNGFGDGANQVAGTAISNPKAVPDGSYYWRVRALTATDHPGGWSAVRTLHKAWTAAPKLQSPLGSTVQWPSTPLVLHWSSVPYAVNYNVYIATDPALSNVVLGSSNSAQQEQGTQFAFPAVLAPGAYYWAVQPIDAEGDKGVRSSLSSFTWAWPTATAVSWGNSSTVASVVDPRFSWSAVPGASSYQVEVSSSSQFAVGSAVCCNDKIVGTIFNPKQSLTSATTLYWRMRAVDALGDAGQWNVGQQFTESYDQLTPTIPNAQMVDDAGSPLPGVAPSTSSPIAKWNPVPGASSYEIQVTPYSNIGCDWTQKIIDADTPTPAWTPIAGGNGNWEPQGWPGPDASDQSLIPGTAYCLRIDARRDDQNLGIISTWTQIAGDTNPAFTYVAPTLGTGQLAATPAGAYVLPATAGNVPTLPSQPLFTWNSVQGANGYYVVVARDQFFTHVIDVAYTDTTAYAPRYSYPDANSQYYWEVVPTAFANGTGETSDPQNGQDNPQAFNKVSVAPVAISPTNGASVSTQPTFQWTSAQGAYNYQLQVAGDPSFANPIEDVTTDAASYTSETTIPAGKTLFWRVRANAWNVAAGAGSSNTGLNWSAVSTFTHQLPVPTPSSSNPKGGTTIPELAWSPVNGATSYNMHVDQSDGSARDFTFDSPAMTPTAFYGTGIWRWKVQAVFPGGATGAYFSPQTYVRTIPAPSGLRASKSGARITFSWSPSPVANRYQIQLSTTAGFSSPVVNDQTDNTAYAPQIDAVTAKQKLFWRVAVVDAGGNVGAYKTGSFRGSKRKKHRKH